MKFQKGSQILVNGKPAVVLERWPGLTAWSKRWASLKVYVRTGPPAGQFADRIRIVNEADVLPNEGEPIDYEAELAAFERTYSDS